MPAKQGSLIGLLSFAGFLSFCAVIFRISAYLHYTLPVPQTSLVDSHGTPQFSEAKALEIVTTLSQHYRIVGTPELDDAVTWVEKYANDLKRQLESSSLKDMHQIEVWHQKGSSSHVHEFMDKIVWKKYHNISNIVVRLSDGTEASKANAILVNAHLDSTLPSPGAADDLAGVSVMFEALRVLSQKPQRVYNAIIFLFNSAEESLSDAAHLFITQSPLRHTIRGVINLEACGMGGPELLFQATSDEMLQIYSHTKHPMGSVMASEVFSSGLILSDTDYRHFEEYGNLTGLDMALIHDSYRYHTRQDIVELIEPGALQHMGENTISMLEHVIQESTTLAGMKKAQNTVYFGALGGRVFIQYSVKTAHIAYSALTAIIAIYFIQAVKRNRFAVHVAATVSIPAGAVIGVMFANLVAFVMDQVVKKPLSFFRHEQLPILLYLPPSLLGIALSQQLLANVVAESAWVAAGERVLEHALLTGAVTSSTIILAIGHSFGLLSFYIFAQTASCLLAALFLNYMLMASTSKSPSGLPISIHTYIFGQVLPMLLGGEGLLLVLDIFVPLTGRFGHEAPADYIIATIVALVGPMTVPMYPAFLHRYGQRGLRAITLLLALISIASVGVFSMPSWKVYDNNHQKRVMGLYMENITSTPPQTSLHIAFLDRASKTQELVTELWQMMDVGGTNAPIRAEISDEIPDYDIIYPVSQFLKAYKVDLPPVTVDHAAHWRSSFNIKAISSALNAVTRTRTLTLQIDHPGIIWSVIAFNADVTAWDLPQPASRGVLRHHVKEASAHGTDAWKLELTIQLSPAQFEAAQRLTQFSKGQRPSLLPGDEELGSLKIDFSGLDGRGMYPATAAVREGESTSFKRPGLEFLERMDKEVQAKLPWIDAWLMTAVSNVVYV